jgi:O-antigen ligase
MVAADKIIFPKITAINVAFWCFAASVILLPLGLGGNRPIPLGLTQIGLAISALCLWLGRADLPPLMLPKRIVIALMLCGMTLLWAALQMQPFVPDGWVHPLWAETAKILPVPVHGVIALMPEDGWVGLMRLTTYILCGMLAYIFGQDATKARQFHTAFLITGMAICLYGLVVYMLNTKSILWFDKWAYQDDLTATFVNRNHFAIYAAVILATGFSRLLHEWRELIHGVKPTARLAAIRHWVMQRGIIWVLLLVLILASIIFSHSRAGLILAIIGLVLSLLFAQIYARRYGQAAITCLVAIVGAVLIVTVFSPQDDRFAGLLVDYSSRDRATVYGIMLQAIHDNPLLGHGLNGFQAVFRLYQQGMFWDFNRGHSDVLESVLDLGIPAAACLWGALALCLSGLWHGVRHRRRHGIYPIIGLTSGLIILLHSGVDFSLQIPGISCTFATLIGIGLAQSWGSALQDSDKVTLR